MWFSKKNKEHNDMNRISFDPETQYAVIRSSICTGEKVAGFKNKKDGHFFPALIKLADTVLPFLIHSELFLQQNLILVE